jgi:hypothetical protein
VLKMQFVVTMQGDLGSRLVEFRERLQLTKRGRLSDDWDQQFGDRIIRSRDEGLIRLSLNRYADDDWNVSLVYERDPLPDAEVTELLDQIRAAASAVGVTVTKQSL